VNIDAPLRYAYRVRRGHGVDGRHDGIVYKNTLASYTHLRDVEGCHWARRFVEFVRGLNGAAE
jgi:cobyrinic acid a,c-diamide synthase